MKKLFILPLAALMLSCGGNQNTNDEKPNVEEFAGIAQKIEGEEPSFQKALPTDGVYIGLLVDENGKLLSDSTILVLKGKTYSKSLKNSSGEPQKGLFQFSDDGQTITLIGAEGLNKFVVSENALHMLNKDGLKVPVDKASGYCLVKRN